MAKLNPLKTLIIVIISVTVTACGGGGGGGQSFTQSSNNQVSSTPSSTQSSSSSSSSEEQSSSTPEESSSSSSTPTSIGGNTSSSAKSSSSSSTSNSASRSSVFIDTEPPTTPTDFIVSDTYPDAVYLAWSPSDDNVELKNYKLFRNGVLLETLGATTLSYGDFLVAPGSTYTYTISAIDWIGNTSALTSTIASTPIPASSLPATASSSSRSSSSNSVSSSTSSRSSSSVDSVSPAAPATLDTTLVTASRVELSWPAATDNVAVTRYRIYRDNAIVATISASTRIYVDTTVSASTAYTYSVSAGDNAGNWSALRTKFVNTPASQSSSSVGTILHWDAPSLRTDLAPLPSTEIGGFEIKYTPPNGGTVGYITLYGSTLSSYNINNLPSGSSYEISCFDTSGLYSDYIAITPN